MPPLLISLEGITNLNTSMEEIAKSVTSMQDLSSTALVGRYVKTGGNVFELAEGKPAEYGYALEDDASNVKITISLRKSSVEFFKKEAHKHRTSYQKMIRRVIDWYASQYQKSA